MTHTTEEPELPSHPSAPIVVPQGDSPVPTQSNTNSNAEKHTLVPYARIAVVAGILLPIAVAPYLLFRRRISLMQRRLDVLESSLSTMKRGISLTDSVVSRMREGRENLGAVVNSAMNEVFEVKQSTEQHIGEQGKRNKEVQSQILKLLDETKDIRTQAATLRTLGASLADVAAFMHEMELHMGLQGGSDVDKRGIQRLRLLALQMQNSSQEEQKEKDKVSALVPLIRQPVGEFDMMLGRVSPDIAGSHVVARCADDQ